LLLQELSSECSDCRCIDRMQLTMTFPTFEKKGTYFIPVCSPSGEKKRKRKEKEKKKKRKGKEKKKRKEEKKKRKEKKMRAQPAQRRSAA